jgi:hypothetical protein
MQGTPFRNHLFYHILGILETGDVCLDGHSFPSGSFNLLYNLVGLSAMFPVVNGNIGAFFCQCDGDGSTDTQTGTGNDSILPFQL